MKSLLVLVALISCVVAEVAQFKKCDESSDDICEISAVRITPCANKASCKLKKGKDANISFDFTPNFSATKMRASLFWVSDGGDLPFPNLSKSDACHLTDCPLESGKKQELSYNLRIAKIFPSDCDIRNDSAFADSDMILTLVMSGLRALRNPLVTVQPTLGKFLLKWKLYNEENEEQVCCFKTNIELKK